jgi:hypothetical protein
LKLFSRLQRQPANPVSSMSSAKTQNAIAPRDLASSRWAFPISLSLFIVIFASALPAKEFLTDKEIEKIQDNREIDLRVKIYLDAAALRLKTAEERLVGKESEPGDPLEFFTPEDMLDGYYRIIKSIMVNLDDAAVHKPVLGRKDSPSADPRDWENRIRKALKDLKSSTEKDADELQILKKLAEEKRKEQLWKLVNDAIDITNGAHEGAEYGLSKRSSSSDRDSKKK